MCLRHQFAIRPEEEEESFSAQVTIRNAELLDCEINHNKTFQTFSLYYHEAEENDSQPCQKR